MLARLFHLLGVTPDVGGKSGKRETAWAMVLIALVLTASSMWIGETMVQAMTAILIGLWASAIALLGGAYKLEHDKQVWKQGSPTMGEPLAPDVPAEADPYPGANDGEL